MAAPISRHSSNEVAAANTIYSGYGSIYRGDSFHSACPDLKYSNDEAVVVMNAAQFGNVKNETSVCGKFVKVSRADNPTKFYTYKIVGLCERCGKNSLGFSYSALREFTNSKRLAIDWELIENEDDESDVMPDSSRNDEDECQNEQDEEDRDDNNDEEQTIKIAARSGTKYRGRGTWFSDTTGSCEVPFSQNDMIVALNENQMGNMSGSGSKCGSKIRVKAKGSSASVIVRVVDTCPDRYCSRGDLDLSRAAFKKFAPMSKGVLELEWSFV
ncbi:hypothetical protein BGZ51_009700 [Haplosporangium sp. Z 767]|nr:hypothetical protein BGZ51_009700 [Haplosporangium sp. Z 767]KAF9194082.1 hypothetical protein BGZ50_006747 [Haplosporangium sp. Z 11]